MTHETRPTVAAELTAAVPLKPAGMGIHRKSAPAGGGVANRAVALGVAADARVEIALRLPCMVSRSAGRERGADEAGGVKLVARHVGAAHRHPHTLVTRETELLLLMAARAARIVLAGRDGVHRNPVVGVHAAGADLAVMAVGAVALGMAAGA